MDVIVAVDQNWAIGRNGEQLFYLREDLRRFRALTIGHPVILGRKTLATFPGGRPLKGRRNLILSATLGFSPPGSEVFPDLDSLLSAAPADSFVIGGASVYRALLSHCRTAYVSRGQASWEADTWFPDLDALPQWQLQEESAPMEEDGLHYRYCTYRNTLWVPPQAPSCPGAASPTSP